MTPSARDIRRAFLRVLLGENRPGEVVYLAKNPPGGKWTEFSFDSVEDAADALDAAGDIPESYLASAWFVQGMGAGAAFVTAKRTVPSDVDAKVCPGATDAERLHNSKVLCETIPAPYVLNCSGGGYHVFLLLPERDRVEYFPDPAEGRAHVAILGRALRLFLESRAVELWGRAVRLDECHGVQRVWRVPESWNAKDLTRARKLTEDKTKWRRVELVRPAAKALADVPPANLQFLVPFIDAAEIEAREEETTKGAPVDGAPPPENGGLLQHAFHAKGWLGKRRSNGVHVVRCPNAEQHSMGEDFDGSTILYPAGPGQELGFLKCLHTHCEALSRTGVLGFFTAEEKAAARKAAGIADPQSRHEDAPEAPRQRAPFPVEALPEPVRSYVREGAGAIGCEPSMIAVPMLAALASAIGNARVLTVKPDWVVPAVVWTQVVAESGTLKSPAERLAVEPLQARQRRDYARWKVDMRAHVQLLASLPKGKGGRPKDAPTPPVLPRTVVSDPTVEALADRLQENPRGLLLFRDELAGWLRSFDQYKAKGKGGDASRWLEAWDAVTWTVDRKDPECPLLFVPRAAVSVTGGIQPDALRRALGVEHVEDGMLARFLITMPPETPKRWTDAEIPSSTKRRVEDLFGLLLALPLDLDEGGGPLPRPLRLSVGARRVFVEWYEEHAGETAKRHGALRYAFAKMEGYVARIALVLHSIREVMGDPTLADPPVVDEASMAAAVRLVRWFRGEAERVYAILGESPADSERRYLVAWIAARGGAATVRDLARGPRAYRGDEARAEAALADLVRRRLGTWESVGPTPRGGHPTRTFRLVAESASAGDGDTTSPHGEEASGSQARQDGGNPQKSGSEAEGVPSPSPLLGGEGKHLPPRDGRAVVEPPPGALFSNEPTPREERRLRDEGGSP